MTTTTSTVTPRSWKSAAVRTMTTTTKHESAGLTQQQEPRIMTVHRGWLNRNIHIGMVGTNVTHNLTITDHLDLNELCTAVDRLMERNPILSGTLSFGNKQNKGIFVQTHQHDTFVHVLDNTDDTSLPSPKDYMGGGADQVDQYLRKYIEPLIPPTQKGLEDLQKGSPLFGIHVILLPDGYVYYAPRLSHAIGDGKTYYMILEELDAILNNKPLPPPIVWEAEGATQFDYSYEMTQPIHFVALIIAHVAYLLWGWLFPTVVIQQPQTIRLGQKAIQQKKKELVQNKQKDPTTTKNYLSTNDVVIAALCQGVVDTYWSLGQILCYRNGRYPGIGDRDAGNITRTASIPTFKGQDANQVRQLIKSIPEQPLLLQNFWHVLFRRTCSVTNWASIQRTLEGTVHHAPLFAYVQQVDWPIAIVYQPNDKEISILHSFQNLKEEEQGLLSELSCR